MCVKFSVTHECIFAVFINRCLITVKVANVNLPRDPSLGYFLGIIFSQVSGICHVCSGSVKKINNFSYLSLTKRRGKRGGSQENKERGVVSFPLSPNPHHFDVLSC